MTLDERIDRLEKAEGPDRELDRNLWRIENPTVPGMTSDLFLPRYTASLDAIVGLIERVLPGFAWKVGTCSVSDDAWICPDHNNPEHGERLMKQFPPVYGTKWDRGIDVDLRPPGRPAIALCIAFCLALQSIGQEEPAQ